MERPLIMSKKRSLLGGLTLALFLPRAVEAHEKWFVDPAVHGPIPEIFRVLNFQSCTAIGVTVLIFAGCVLLDRGIRRLRATRITAGRLRRLYRWAPTVLGVSTGVGLASFALNRAILAFNLPAPDNLVGTILIAVEFGAAVLLILGFLSRLAALAIMALLVAGFVWYPPTDALDLIHFLGIAVFIFAWGRGRFSLGSVFSRLVASAPSHVRPAATLALRVTLGLGLIVLALGKVLRPDLHLALFDAFPWNPLVVVHYVFSALTPDWYVLYLILAEALVGSLLLFGLLLRPLAVLLAVLFAASVLFLPAADLLGHLSYIGAAAALAILGRSGEKEQNS